METVLSLIFLHSSQAKPVPTFNIQYLSFLISLPFSLFTYSPSNSTLGGKRNGEKRRNISSVTSFHHHGAIHFVFPMQDMFSAISLSPVVQYLLKSAGMNYTAYQHTLFFTIFLLSHPLLHLILTAYIGF